MSALAPQATSKPTSPSERGRFVEMEQDGDSDLPSWSDKVSSPGCGSESRSRRQRRYGLRGMDRSTTTRSSESSLPWHLRASLQGDDR